MDVINISVAKQHIDNGVCKYPQKCAIAMAIKDLFPDVSYVAVRTNGITVTSRTSDGGTGSRVAGV